MKSVGLPPTVTLSPTSATRYLVHIATNPTKTPPLMRQRYKAASRVYSCKYDLADSTNQKSLGGRSPPCGLAGVKRVEQRNISNIPEDIHPYLGPMNRAEFYNETSSKNVGGKHGGWNLRDRLRTAGSHFRSSVWQNVWATIVSARQGRPVPGRVQNCGPLRR